MKYLFDNLPDILDPVHINTDMVFRGTAVSLDPVFNKATTRFSKKYGNDFSIAYSNLTFIPIDIIGNTFKLKNGYVSDFAINDLITYYDGIAHIDNINLTSKVFTLDQIIDPETTSIVRSAVKLDVTSHSYESYDADKIIGGSDIDPGNVGSGYTYMVDTAWGIFSIGDCVQRNENNTGWNLIQAGVLGLPAEGLRLFNNTGGNVVLSNILIQNDHIAEYNLGWKDTGLIKTIILVDDKYLINDFDKLISWDGVRITPYDIISINKSGSIYEIITMLHEDQVWLTTFPLYDAKILLKSPIYCSFFDVMQKDLQTEDNFRVTVKDAGDNILEVLNSRWDVLLGDITFNHLALWDNITGNIKLSNTRIHLYCNEDGYFELSTKLIPTWIKDKEYTWIYSINNLNSSMAKIIIELNNTKMEGLAGMTNHYLDFSLLANIEATNFSIKIIGEPNAHFEMSGLDLLTTPDLIHVECSREFSIERRDWWHTGVFMKPFFMQYKKDPLNYITNSGKLL